MRIPLRSVDLRKEGGTQGGPPLRDDGAPSLELPGRRVVVTAAGAGIGLVIAKLFAAAGARVEICDLDDAKLKAVTETALSIGVSRCDLADARHVERFARDAFGRPAESTS